MVDLEKAHGHSAFHRAEVEGGEVCGCFHCLETFPPSAIRDWVDVDEDWKGHTALCPYCKVDAVLGDRSGFPVGDDAFLRRMREAFFTAE